MTANQKISAQVLLKISEGMDPIEALKAVCGSENVDQMIDSLYTDLRSRDPR